VTRSILSLKWIMALKLPDGSPFMADSLRRYGFLPNDASPDMLPVGFTAAGQPEKFIGMTCAACHTRQVEYMGTEYRIDGGPAIIDFQRLVSDLDTAVGRVLNNAKAFAGFAGIVLGSTHAPTEETVLGRALSVWYHRYHTLMHKALPPTPWGPGRLDAVGMIFNRLAGLDLGPQSTSLIEKNIKVADAPVRYPFLWNAAKQDRTQWLGFADNSNVIVAVGRNLGQVFGVFAEFHPEIYAASGDINYALHNSAELVGLLDLEKLMASIGPPLWPWAIDNALADNGKKIFERDTAAGGCVECHGEKPSDKDPNYWKTPITPIDDLNTDHRQIKLLDVRSNTGILEGTEIKTFDGITIYNKNEKSLDLLTLAVTGTFRDYTPKGSGSVSALILNRTQTLAKLKAMNDTNVRGYEARVLHGIWAAAPYLHNGSVPTLTELLKPPARRKPSFKIGAAYDPAAVGLAAEQPDVRGILETTDCSDRGSGNSRCGHEYGTTLPDT
jgi:cytochrome c553